MVFKINIILFILLALVSVSEEVRSRCHVKHTRWQTESLTTEVQPQETTGTQNVRRQKSWDMLDQSAIAYARQQQHKVPHQVTYHLLFLNFMLRFEFDFSLIKLYFDGCGVLEKLKIGSKTKV